jgi:hypothetical protein
VTFVTCVVCGQERTSDDPQAYEDEVCSSCRGKRRIARMIDVIKRDMQVPTYDWDGTPAPPVGIATLNRLNGRGKSSR